MTTQEKSKVICDRLGIKHGRVTGGFEERNFGLIVCSCGKEFINKLEEGSDCSYSSKEFWSHLKNPIDFFSPDIKERRNNQAVLAGALLEIKNRKTFVNLSYYIHDEKKVYGVRKPSNFYLEIIAETKLAQLFYEFIESEKDNV